MASPIPIPLLWCLLLLLSLSLVHYCSLVHGDETHQSVHSISLGSRRPSTSCSSSTASSDNKLRVTHRHGPCSPHPERKPSHKRILRREQARAAALQRRISGRSLAGVSIPGRSGLPYETLEYIVTLGYGTPAKNFSVIFDTGSDLSWIQCQPCIDYCYPQNDTLFDPAQSSTYANISCTSADCFLVGVGCYQSTCVYQVQYGDGSFTEGLFAEDTLTLTPSDALTGFNFGCGEMNSDRFGRVAGLVGLGRGEVSLVSQASKAYGSVFSYCLPSTPSSTGYLALGASAAAGNVSYTPMLTNPAAPSFYFLELIAIKVGGKNLSIPSTTFTDTGTIIDSGTVITHLPPSAYAALRDEFRRQMSNYTMAPPFSILDTCYNFTGLVAVTVPTVSLGFAGGTWLRVDVLGLLYFVDDYLAQVCLAFVGNADASAVSIIGNMQQMTYEVVYDLDKGMIGFGAGGCD